jgi:hypothetical protein
MSLHLQITTSLGRETHPFDQRGPDKPIVLGRGASCDVQLPSTRIAGQQAAFFFSRGTWAVQNVDPRVPLTLNGRRVDGATPIVAGDVVSLGAPEDPTTIVVLQAITTIQDVPAAQSGSIGDAAASTHDAADEPQAVAWTPAAPSRARAAALARRNADRSGASLVVGVGLTILFIAAAFVLFHRQQKGYWLWQSPPAPPPAADVRPPTAVSVDSAGRGSKLFGEPPKTPLTPPAAPTASRADRPSNGDDPRTSAPEAKPGTTSGLTGAPPSTSPADAPTVATDIEANPVYQKFVDVYYRSDAASALYQFEDYLRRDDTTATPELRTAVKKLRDKLLDRLWWQRLREMQQQYARAKTELDNFARDYPPSTLAQYSPARKRELIAQRDQATEDMKIAQATLTDEFNHPLADPAPNPADLDAIAAARPNRDAAKWESFQRHVIATVMRTRGAMAY